MRTYNAVGYQLVGATAAALLVFFNQPQQVSATTEAPPSTVVRMLNVAPASAPAPQAAPAAVLPVTTTAPIIVEKPAEVKPEAKPTEATAAPAPHPAPAETAEAPPAPAKPKPLPPTLVARINLTTQTMVVQAGNKTIHSWKVSTGAPGYSTPPGSFKPSWMAQMWHSRQYDDAPMPYSVFFNGGIAVHGTMNPGSLGSPRSHGCARLATSNAATFFKLVNRHGMAQTRIIVHGKQPYGNSQMMAARSANKPARAANAWVYTNTNSANRAGARPAASRYDSYGYQPKPASAQPRRISAVRTQSTYWTR